MAGAFDSFVRRNLHALYGISKLLLIPSVVLSFVALFTPTERGTNLKIAALTTTSVVLHCVGSLAILQWPFFFIIRKISFSSAMAGIFALVFTAFVISMTAGCMLAQEESPSSRALWYTWAMVVVDFINIFVVGVTLGRGSDVDEGVKEMITPVNAGFFLTRYRGLLYRIMQLLLGIGLGLSAPSVVHHKYYQRRRSVILYVALGFQGVAFLISVAAPYYIPMRRMNIATCISYMLFFTVVAFVLQIAAGAEYFYETPINVSDGSPVAFDIDINPSSFGFGWTVAITDAVNIIVFIALLRGLAIDSDPEDDEDIAQSNVRERRYKAWPQIISQGLLAASTGISGAAMAHGDSLTFNIRAASMSVHAVALLLTFHLLYRFMLRITNLLAVSVFLFTLVFAAFALLIAAGITSTRRMDYNANDGAWGVWCNWTAVVIDFVNLIIMIIPLNRGWKRVDDSVDMELI